MVKKNSTKKAAKKSGANGARRSSGGRRPFPRASLEDALKVAYAIKEKNGGNAWTPAEIATAIDVGGSTNRFYYITAAARDFGLTEGSSKTDTISLTPFGREAIYALSSEEERAKRLEAFKKIELYDKVLKHYSGSKIPEMKYLSNTLEREFGLDTAYHEEFAKLFRADCTYLQITDVPSEAGEEGSSARSVVVGESKTGSDLVAFVIMPFWERNSDRPKGFFAETLRSLITPAAVDAGFSVETANRDGSDVIQATIINKLLDADLVIADLTDHNPNVFFELGLRMAADKPVALVKAAGTGRVFDVDNMLRVVEYSPQLWTSTIEADVPKLRDHISQSWENRDDHASYMKILRQPVPASGLTN